MKSEAFMDLLEPVEPKQIINYLELSGWQHESRILINEIKELFTNSVEQIFDYG